MLLNNTLLSRVYNKPLIVVFGQVVCTLSIARVGGSVPTSSMSFYFFYFAVFSFKKLLSRQFTVLLLVLLNQRSQYKYIVLRLNKDTMSSQHRNKEVGKRNKPYM